MIILNQEVAHKKSNENSIVLMKNQKIFLNHNQFSTNQIFLHSIFRKINVLYVHLYLELNARFFWKKRIILFLRFVITLFHLL